MNSCVIITSKLEQDYCVKHNISKNDLGKFFNVYANSKYTKKSDTGEFTDELLASDEFKSFFNWYFKLGNSRFLIESPSSYQKARKDWETLKNDYKMSNEGVIKVFDNKTLSLLTTYFEKSGFKTHYTVYKDIDGIDTIKLEEPVYTGRSLSKVQTLKLENIQIQTVEDIQELLLSENIIHKYKGKWRLTKTNEGLKKLRDYIKEGVIDETKVRYYQEGDTVVLEFLNNGGFLFQATPDLKRIIKENNRPLKALGSNKKIAEMLKRSNLSPELREAIFSAIEKNPALKEQSLGSILTAMSILRDRDLLNIYNEAIGKEIDERLDSFLMNYLREFNYRFNIKESLEEFGGYDGVTDALNKVIYLAKNRNKITAAEEFSHAFMKLLGVKHPDFKFLLEGVEKTEIYKQVLDVYSDIYVITDPDGTKRPDYAKIKEEAIGQALASAIVDKWDTSHKPESEKTWWDKLKEWVNSILAKFENKDYISFDTLIDKIATEVLENNKERLTKKYDKVETSLLDYVETIENQNKKDGGKALNFLRYFTNIGNVITGSLSYRYQGTVYRPGIDSIHDIDMKVPKSVHNFGLSDMEFNALRRARDTSELANIILSIDYFRKIKTDFPKMKFADFVVLQRNSGIKTYFISGVYSENEELSAKFLRLTGDYASRLNQFTEEERSQIYLFDFFLEDREVPAIYDPTYGLSLSPWQESFKVKIDQMGRDKDTFDHKKWVPFEKFVDNITTPTEDLMFQASPKNPVENTTSGNIDYLKLYDLYIGDPNYTFAESQEEAREKLLADNIIDENDNILNLDFLKPRARGKMTYSYGNSKRQDVKSTSTFEAILKGERTATTRFESDGHIDYWKTLEEGNIIEFEGANGEKLLARVTRPLHKLKGSGKTAEQWSKLEGWSTEYFNTNVRPRLDEAWQIEFELLDANFSKVSSDNYQMFSGGATGADSYWDVAGESYRQRLGHSEPIHWYTEGTSTPRGNRAISQEDYTEGAIEMALSAQRMYGQRAARMKDANIIRDWAQVKYADAVFAVGNLVGKGTKWSDRADDSRITTVDTIIGGTGYAVNAAILHGKPVYVYNQADNATYARGWYTYDAASETYVPIATPRLTKNFAAIGTRNLNVFGEKAIRDVYYETFDRKGDFTKADDIYNSIRKAFYHKVKFNAAEHKYYVKQTNGAWKEVDTTASTYANSLNGKNEDIKNNKYFAISTALGNTNDMFVRDFWKGEVKSYYPNLTQEQHATLLNSLYQLKNELDVKFPNGYKVVADEFPIYGVLTKDGEDITIGGTMDLLIYTPDGKFYIYDMKTRRGGIIQELSLQSYSTQQYLYKHMLESGVQEARGKVQTPVLIVSKVNYPEPNSPTSIVEKYEKTDNGEVIAVVNTEKGTKRIPITQLNGYVAPVFKGFQDVSTVVEKDIKEALKELNLTKEEFELEFGQLKAIKRSLKEEAQTVSLDPKQSKEAAALQELHTIIPAEELSFLGKDIVMFFSRVIDKLMSSADAKQKWNATRDLFNNVDFTTMSREEVLNTPFLVERVLDGIVKKFYDPDFKSNKNLSEGTRNKLKLVYDNFDIIVRASYAEFIRQEGFSPKRGKAKQDGFDESIQNTEDPTVGENNDREYWQIGVRNMSVMSGLSNKLKRFLSTIRLMDENGQVVVDRFGYNKAVLLNGNEAANSLLLWLKDCNTIDEMLKVLNKMKTTHFWIENLLEEFNRDPNLLNEFFYNFRKDFTEYSIIQSIKDAATGEWVTINKIINTVGASEKMLSEIKDAYFNKDLAIYKDVVINGEVVRVLDTTKIASLKDKINSIITTLRGDNTFNSFKNDPLSSEYLKEIRDVLNQIGVMLDLNMLADITVFDNDKVNFIATNLYKILEEANYITAALLGGSRKDGYDPLAKGGNSTYNNYKNITVIAEPFVTQALEASTYANGKMYYSFVPPSYLGQLLNNLVNNTVDENNFRNYLQDNYGKYEWFKTNGTWNIQWLRDIEDVNTRGNIRRKVQLSFEGTDYVDLTEKAYTLSLLREYFYDTNKSFAWYRIPTLSNKPSSEFIRNKRYSVDYEQILGNQLYDIVLQEIKRARTVVERAISNIDEGAKIKTFDIKPDKKGYIEKVLNKIKNKETVTIKDLFIDGNFIFENSGASFKFLNEFNNLISIEGDLSNYIIDKVFNLSKNISQTTDAEMKPIIKNNINNIMEAKVESLLDYYEQIGLLNIKDLKFIDPSISLDKKASIEEIKQAYKPYIAEYVWNDFVATANIIQLTTTDLAFYKDSVDFQKRYAQIHSPGLRLNKLAKFENGTLVSDGKFRTLYISDVISKSEIETNVKVALENHYNNMPSATEEDKRLKEEFKKMIDIILSGYSSINEADAQAYSCPTSYMKKMRMSGQWTADMQKAYERIKNGNYNINDLGVVWQPLKPFVYTQTGVKSGVTTSANIKVPSQHKNSEYMLLIADALTRGDKQNNKLNAIMDFMEKSHEDSKGNYTNNGIDTIEFNSAIKVGEYGTLDIKDIPANKVQKYLEDKVLKNKDAVEDELKYNVNHVHAYPVEDYAIQQNVPAHFKEHTQPMGSQVRALILGDLSPIAAYRVGNQNYSKSDVNTVYQDLIARNVYRSYDEVVRDLGIKGETRYERNSILSAILVKEIEKDGKYGEDLKRAVMLNSEGEFVVPLDDAIHSGRIQQLVNSIVKSRINKQRVNGGPVVQVSSFGLSDDLNIIFEDSKGKELDTYTKFKNKRENKGLSEDAVTKAYEKYLKEHQAKVKHFECYIPVPSGLFEELLMVDDGKGGKRLLSVEEALNKDSEYYVEGLKDCLNAIGYRIPTEDIYSMAPLKIKGFVPKAAGEVVLLPKEITLLSGSDFDIDKMYIMLPEFRRMEYDKRKAYQDYMEEKGDVATDKMLKAIFGDLAEMGDFKEWFEANKDSYKVSRGIEKVYYKALDPKAEDYKESLDKMNKRQVNNHIFDIQWSVITNAATASKLFNPGSFDVQKKASRMISIARNVDSNLEYEDVIDKSFEELDKHIAKESRNILDVETQIYFFNQNMTAGKLIGVFANANVSHIFSNLLNIKIDTLPFKLNGKQFGNVQFDPTYSLRGRYLSKNLAGYIGASVDAVKDPVFANMNINMDTINPALVLIRMGVDPEEIALITSQPIVMKFSKRMSEAKDSRKHILPEDVILNILMEEYSVSKEEIETVRNSMNTNDFTSKELFNNIRNENIELSIKIGVLWAELIELAQPMRQLTYCTKFNSITNAPGPFFTDNLFAKQRVDNFVKSVRNPSPMQRMPFSIEAAYIIDKNPILKSIYKTTIGDGNVLEQLAGEHWKHYTDTFKDIVKSFNATLGIELNGEAMENVYMDYIYYCMTAPNMIDGENIPVIDPDGINNLLVNFPRQYKEILAKLKESKPEVYELKIANNLIINAIEVRPPSNKFPLETITLHSGKMDSLTQEDFKNAWSSLILSDDKDVKLLGVSLFHYNLYRNGFKFSPKTFLHLASVDVKNNIYNYIETLRDASKFSLDEEHIQSFVMQYIRNHPDDFKLEIEDEVGINANQNYIEVDVRIPDALKAIRGKIGEFSITIQPVIEYNGELYISKGLPTDLGKHPSGVKTIIYHKVSRLGSENNAIEYKYEGDAFIPSKLEKAIMQNQNHTNKGYTYEDDPFGMKKITYDDMIITDRKARKEQTVSVGEDMAAVVEKLVHTTPETSDIMVVQKEIREYILRNFYSTTNEFSEPFNAFLNRITKDNEIKETLNNGFDENGDIITGEDLFRSIYNQIQEITKDLCKA